MKNDKGDYPVSVLKWTLLGTLAGFIVSLIAEYSLLGGTEGNFTRSLSGLKLEYKLTPLFVDAGVLLGCVVGLVLRATKK